MDKLISCPQCKRTFKTERGFKTHEATHQAASAQGAGCSVDEGKNLLRCLVCGKPYKTLHGLRKHAAVHNISGETNESHSSENAAAGDQVFKCSICNKTYKSANGLEKHELTHSLTVTTDATVDESLPENIEGEEFNVPDDDESQPTQSDTVVSYCFEEDDEAEEHLRNLQLEGGASETNKGKKKTKKKPLVICPRCKHESNTIDNYLKHKATHVMSDLYLGAPSTDFIVSKSTEFSQRVLEKISNTSSAAGFCSLIRDTAKVLLIMNDSEEWQVIVQRMVQGLSEFFNSCQQFVTPSDLRFEFLKATSKYMADKVERQELATGLQAFVEISQEAAGLFIGAYLRKLSNELLIYYVHHLIHNDKTSSDSYVPLNARFAITSQPTDSLDFKQLMHYIGGANVKSILRGAFRIKNPNHEWLKVIDVVKNYFVCCEFSLATPPEKDLRAWTETQDRGGLIKISADLLDFYLELAPTVKCMEHINGSLLIDEVMEKVLENNRLMIMWCELLRQSLSQESSFKLLHALCTYFCNTWGRGIITRRLDEMSAANQSVGVKHGMGGVAFRASISSTK